MISFRPERINLSIGSRCWVSCVGCYTFFGSQPAQLSKLRRSVARFVELGIADVTLSGGDPLLVDGIALFLTQLRESGVRGIKLDTVGTSLLGFDRVGPNLAEILSLVDVLGLPLDGWSEGSVALFRHGRARLFRETCEILSALDASQCRPSIYINTVAHAGNISGLTQIYGVLRRYVSVDRWNIFQYTPTDQVPDTVNLALQIRREAFQGAANRLFRKMAHRCPFEIEFASNAGRLGRYLLINSDGEVWAPDGFGRTISFGPVFNREEKILAEWSRFVVGLRQNSTDGTTLTHLSVVRL